MTAAIATLPNATGHRPLGSRPAPPRLRVIDGGRSAQPSPAVLWRRRAVALALATVLVVVTWWGISAVLRLTLGSPVGGSSAPGTVGAEVADAPFSADAGVYVVQEGDTLAGIAQRVDPTAPWQRTADRLVELNGSNAVQPGQRLLLG